MPTAWLTPEAAALDVAGALAAYRAEGFAVLRGAVTADGLAALRARADDLVSGRVDPAPFFYQHDSPTGRYEHLPYGEGWVGPSERYRKLEKLERDPVFRAFLQNDLFRRLAQEVVGERVRLYRAVLMAKGAREADRPGGTPLPWHQDAGTLWGLDREPELQLWTALDPAPEKAGCLAVLPKSHLGGLATPLGGMVPSKLVEAARADERAVLVPAQPGDVVLLHNLVWHASGTNHTPHPRRAFSVCFLHEATRCTRRKRAPREFWEVFG